MTISNKIDVQSVSELTRSIKNTLERGYRFIHVQGEVSNLRVPFSGHYYFSLKDEKSQIKAVLFKGQQKFLDKKIEDEQKIICHGRISVYEPRGDYQLIVDTVDQVGTGNLQIEFEKLKHRLFDEGLFAQERKKKIPPFPQKISLITSPTGAAVHDFLKISTLRNSFCDITIFPVRVQGKGAAEEMAQAISKINTTSPESEIIVLCRGGGSSEDLWAFNEECLARAIYQSNIPVVTGVGHEIDITIADYCADYRASTPTNAAESLFIDSNDYSRHIQLLKQSLISSIHANIQIKHEQVQKHQRFLGNLDSLFTTNSLKIDLLTSKLIGSMHSNLHGLAARYQTIISQLQSHRPHIQVKIQAQKLTFLQQRLQQQLQTVINKKEAEFSKIIATLDSVSPLSTLSRGYAVVTKSTQLLEEHEIIRDSSQVQREDSINIRLHKGNLQCKVSKVS